MFVNWYKENYFRCRVEVEAEESEILTNDSSIQGYVLNNVFNKKFNYHDLKERKIIIHALSQIPIFLVEYSTFKDFDKNDIELSQSHRTLKISKYFKNQGLEPTLPYYTHGHYNLIYHIDTNQYSFDILYSEGAGLKEDAYCSIHAIGFDTEKELFDFVKKARSFGITNFLLEKEKKENKKHIDEVNRERIKEDILLSMP